MNDKEFTAQMEFWAFLLGMGYLLLALALTFWVVIHSSAWGRYYIRRWRNRATWWVCEYEVKPKEPSYLVSEEGSFAVHGASLVEAMEDAQQTIKTRVWVTGTCNLRIRRPSWIEVLFG